MNASRSSGFQDCNCLAIRQAARHVTQFYDQLFAPVGLRATQFAILSRLRHDGPLTINALAGALVMDRTTLGRNILPLERDGLIEIVASPADRRRRELCLSKAGAEKQIKGWITEADSDYNDGLYEDAIKLYEKALKADPGNRQLQTKLQRARKAKTTEESLH